MPNWLRMSASVKIALIMLMFVAWMAILFWQVTVIVIAAFVLLAAGWWAASPGERTQYGFREDLTGRPYW